MYIIHFCFFLSSTEEQLLRQKCATLQRHHADYWLELADCYQRTAVQVWNVKFKVKTNDAMAMNDLRRSCLSEKIKTHADLSEVIDCQAVPGLTSDEQVPQITPFMSRCLQPNDRDSSAESPYFMHMSSTADSSMLGSIIPELVNGRIRCILTNTCELFRPYLRQKACMQVSVAAESTTEASYLARQLPITAFHSASMHLPITHPSTGDTASNEFQTIGQCHQDHFQTVVMEKCTLLARETDRSTTLDQFVLWLDSFCDVFVYLVLDQSGKSARSVLDCIQNADLEGHLLLVALLMLAVIATLLWAQ